MPYFDHAFVLRGFLAKEIADHAPEIRAASTEWFAFADKLNTRVQALAVEGSEVVAGSRRGGSQSPETVATMLIWRCLGNFQGTVLMAERGMYAEAGTLARNLLEAFFQLAALTADAPEALDLIWFDGAKSRRGINRFILQLDDIDPDQRARIETSTIDIETKITTRLAERAKRLGVQNNNTRIPDTGVKAIANKGPLGKFYLYYKYLSDDAAHPSLSSIHKHLNIATDGLSWSNFLVGPSQDDSIRKAMAIAMKALFYAAVAFGELTQTEWPELADYSDELADLERATAI